MKLCLRPAVEGYEPRIIDIDLPDPEDRHVLAAAIHGGCDVILTFNLSDFPVSGLAPYGISALGPDPFFEQCLSDNPLPVLAALRAVRRRLTRPPYTSDDFLLLLKRQGLTRASEALRPFVDVL